MLPASPHVQSEPGAWPLARRGARSWHVPGLAAALPATPLSACLPPPSAPSPSIEGSSAIPSINSSSATRVPAACARPPAPGYQHPSGTGCWHRPEQRGVPMGPAPSCRGEVANGRAGGDGRDRQQPLDGSISIPQRAASRGHAARVPCAGLRRGRGSGTTPGRCPGCPRLDGSTGALPSAEGPFATAATSGGAGSPVARQGPCPGGEPLAPRCQQGACGGPLLAVRAASPRAAA